MDIGRSIGYVKMTDIVFNGIRTVVWETIRSNSNSLVGIRIWDNVCENLMIKIGDTVSLWK